MSKSKTNVQPWERQPGESTKAFEAFKIYRDLGPSERSQAKVKEALERSSRTTISDWSVKFNWKKRVEAWDDEQDRIIRADHMKEIKKMRKRHADIATAMLVKASKALQKIPVEEITAKEMSQMIDIGTKLERISRGDSGDVIETRDGGEAISPVTFYMPNNHRDDEEGADDE